jgi:hypothetical protein
MAEMVGYSVGEAGAVRDRRREQRLLTKQVFAQAIGKTRSREETE